MSQMHELPGENSFGYDFNYAQWTANTSVMLCNVPWSNTYKDIVPFPSRESLNTYLEKNSGPVINVPNMTYHRPGHTIKLPIPYGRALGFNYLRASNPAQPGQAGDTPQDYYYFVSAVNHINPGTTEFVLQLDVWQSYGHLVQFGNCYMQQGHYGVANIRAMDDNGREHLTVPEGLDLGSEYQIQNIYSRSIASARESATDGYSILVTSTVAIDEEPGTVDKPKMKSATGNFLENLPNGAETYYFQNVGKFKEFLEAYQDKPWITQGIISIMAIPGNTMTEYRMKLKSKIVSGMSILEVDTGHLKTVKTTIAENWRKTLRDSLPERYRHLDKLLTYPYTVLELTAHTGTPIMLKPESWAGFNMEVVEVVHLAQPSPRIMFYPFKYNAKQDSLTDTDEHGIVHDRGEHLDMATGIFNFPTFSLVNNGYMSFMASNSNNIAYQHSSADWSQQRAMAGADLAAQQATAGIGLSQEVTGIGIDASRSQTTLNNSTAALRGMQGAITGALGAAGSGNALGAVGAIASNAASTGITIYGNEQAFGINSGATRATNAAQTGNMGYIRDTNKAYAEYAAKGDYSNTIAGIEAKVQDAKMIQPTTSGQVGGDAFMLSQFRWGYDVKVKTLQGAALRSVGEYFLRYGYRVHRFVTPPKSLQVMTHFTYWKLAETYLIAGRMPEAFKETIRGIFEKGVTVWANPDYIGRVDIGENKPLEGIILK